MLTNRRAVARGLLKHQIVLQQVTAALKAEATSLQALHVYLFKSLKDLEV